MLTNELLDKTKEKIGINKEIELARKLGIAKTRLSNYRELRGSTLKIRSLKQELERKISETQAPVIILQWPDREVKLAYPYSVVK